MMPLLLLLRQSRAAQIAIAVIAAVLAISIWLLIHDAHVRAEERARIERRAKDRAEKARVAADKQKEDRDAAFNQSQAELRNSSDVPDYLARLRAKQCAERPAAC